MHEVVAVARAHGRGVPEDYAQVRLQLADEVSPDMTSSMHHDLQRGNRLEVRWLAGGVVELGRAKGVPTPLNRAIADILALHAEGAQRRLTPAAPWPGCACAASAAPPSKCRLRYVLGTSAATVRAAPLLLVEPLTEQGVIGRSYVFCYRRSGAKAIAAVLQDAAELAGGDARRAAGDRRQAASAALRCSA